LLKGEPNTTYRDIYAFGILGYLSTYLKKSPFWMVKAFRKLGGLGLKLRGKGG